MFQKPCVLFLAAAISVGGCLTAALSAAERHLARGGQAEAVICVGQQAGEFERWVAGELQRYIKQLSGAELPVMTDEKLPAGKPTLVVGTPATNPVVASAQKQGLVDFASLKPQGLVLKSVELDGRPAVIVGGADEAGTMYAAYELLERLGIVFQLTNDVIPQQNPDLELPALDVRMEPVFMDRGMHCWHGIRWYMGLKELRQEIDQLAKLKMNVFQFYWGMGGPWAEFSYGGRAAEITGISESGFVAWPGASGTADSVWIGRQCFPEDGYLGPPEFARVQTQEQAYRTAREFLREVIRYAHSRKVQVWLAMGEMPFVPPNLVPPSSKPGRSFYCGVALSPGDPAVLDIWEAAMASMIESYPEADRYWVVSGSELLGSTKPVHGMPADDPRIGALIADYARLRPLLPEKSQAAASLGLADLDLADIAAADKLVRRIKARFPPTKLGLELIFRGGQLRALDAALPKDVALMNMVNFQGETAMSYFAGIPDRDLVVWPRITDDGCELNMQLNALMYDHDEVIPGGVRHGLTGILGQLNKARGAEQSAGYIAEGAWNPAIRCQSFYDRYVRRLYGPQALDAILKAFLLLEENEQTLGWHGRRGLFSTWAASCRMGIRLRRVNYRQDKLQLDRQQVEQSIQAAEGERAFWDGRAAHCRTALQLLREARPEVWPGSSDELDYVIYKTDNFITVFDLLAAVQETKAVFDRALLAVSDGDKVAATRHLDETQTALDRANRLVREAAEQMIPYAHIPTERHILWIFNKAIPSHQAERTYLADVVAFHTGERLKYPSRLDSPVATPPALIAHWTFDSASGLQVPFTGQAGGLCVAFEGTLTGAGQIATDGSALIGAGAYLGAASPENDSGITLAGSAVGSDGRTVLGRQLDLGTAQSMSFSAWVKSERVDAYGTLFHGYAAVGHAGYAVQTWPATGQPRYHPGWSESPYYDDNGAGLPNLMDGQWHHLVVTADGAAVRFYVDGKTEPGWSRVQAAISQGRYTGDRFIGHHANTEYDSQLVGRLDDMGIWKNRTLSALDVAILSSLGRVQGSNLLWLDAAAALWAGDVGGQATIDGVRWGKATGLRGKPGDWGGSKATRDGFIVLDESGGGLRMAAPP